MRPTRVYAALRLACLRFERQMLLPCLGNYVDNSSGRLKPPDGYSRESWRIIAFIGKQNKRQAV